MTRPAVASQKQRFHELIDPHRRPAGPEWTGHRDYAPGDDLRAVDWFLCARHDELYTRQIGGEIDGRAYFLLDCSRSMSLGSPSKFDLARRVVTALASSAIGAASQVRISAFAEGMVVDSDAVRGPSGLARLERFLRSLKPEFAPTDFAKYATGWSRRSQRRGPVVVVSDLCSPDGFERGLGSLCDRGYQAGVVQIFSPQDEEPNISGDVLLADAESEATWDVTVTEQHAELYRRLFAEFLDSARRFCDRHALPCMQIRSDQPVPACSRISPVMS